MTGMAGQQFTQPGLLAGVVVDGRQHQRGNGERDLELLFHGLTFIVWLVNPAGTWATAVVVRLHVCVMRDVHYHFQPAS